MDGNEDVNRVITVNSFHKILMNYLIAYLFAQIIVIQQY
jgi:hypothetical protein